MDVQPRQVEPRRAEGEAHGALQMRERHAELAVLLRCLDETVRMRLDAGAEAQQDLLPEAALRAEARQQCQLVFAVNRHRADALFQPGGEERLRLGVAVQRHALHREARRAGDAELAQRHRVEAQPLFVDQTRHGDVQKSFAGVADARVPSRHRGAQPPATVAQHRFVHHVQRRAVLFCQRHCVAATPDQMIHCHPIPSEKFTKKRVPVYSSQIHRDALHIFGTRYHPA